MSSASTKSTKFFSSVAYNDYNNYAHVVTLGPANTKQQAIYQICKCIASQTSAYDERLSYAILEAGSEKHGGWQESENKLKDILCDAEHYLLIDDRWYEWDILEYTEE